MFFNPDFSVIDAAIVKDPKLGDLIMIVKNENSNPPEKNLRVTRTKKIEKGFPTKVSAPITGKYWAEGPAPLFVGDTLYVYFDKYRDHRYGAVRSLRSWRNMGRCVRSSLFSERYPSWNGVCGRCFRGGGIDSQSYL